MLPIETLKTFVAAAESGSFTQAGKVVSRTQAAVSMQMKRLEDELGKQLFLRQVRAVKLTPAGEALLPYAHRLIGLHDEAVATLAEPEVHGRARLGAPEDYASVVLPEILVRFARAFPHGVVDVRCEATEKLMAALERGELDLTLCTTAEHPQQGVLLRREPVVWVASARHQAQEKRPLPLALFAEGCAYRGWAIQALEAAGIPYRIAFESPSVAGVLASVRSGLAIAPVGRSIVPDDVRILGPADGLPTLPAAYVSLQTNPATRSSVIKSLGDEVIRAFAALEPPASSDSGSRHVGPAA